MQNLAEKCDSTLKLVVMSFFNDMENLKVLNISNIKGVKQNYVFFFFLYKFTDDHGYEERK